MKFLLVILTICIIICFTACNNQDKINDLQNELNESSSESTEASMLGAESDVRDDYFVDVEYLTTMTALQYGASDAMSNVRLDIELTDQKYIDDTVDQKITLTIDGVECEYAYVESTKGWLYENDYHYYRGMYNGKGTEIFIDSQTGECIRFLRFPYESDGENEQYTQDQKYKIAYEFLCENVEDPQQYQWDPNMGLGVDYFWFYRYVGELETCDHMIIAVDDAGEVFSYHKKNLGDMRNIQSIPESVMESVNEILVQKVNALYRLIEKEGCTWTYETEIDRLVRMADGAFALDCVVDVTVVTIEGQEISGAAWFIIPITEPTVQTE